MEPWLRVLVLSLGGALGVNARYWSTLVISRWAGSRFPWATVSINVAGSLAAGFLAAVIAARFTHPYIRLFMVVGFLGGFTTFSAFSLESLALWERGDVRLALVNMVGSVAAGFTAAALGAALARGGFPPPPPIPVPVPVPVSTESQAAESSTVDDRSVPTFHGLAGPSRQSPADPRSPER